MPANAQAARCIPGASSPSVTFARSTSSPGRRSHGRSTNCASPRASGRAKHVRCSASARTQRTVEAGRLGAAAHAAHEQTPAAARASRKPRAPAALQLACAASWLPQQRFAQPAASFFARPCRHQYLTLGVFGRRAPAFCVRTNHDTSVPHRRNLRHATTWPPHALRSLCIIACN